MRPWQRSALTLAEAVRRGIVGCGWRAPTAGMTSEGFGDSTLLNSAGPLHAEAISSMSTLRSPRKLLLNRSCGDLNASGSKARQQEYCSGL
jgi:hypothetical protein